jgi:hypothetical protein
LNSRPAPRRRDAREQEHGKAGETHADHECDHPGCLGEQTDEAACPVVESAGEHLGRRGGTEHGEHDDSGQRDGGQVQRAAHERGHQGGEQSEDRERREPRRRGNVPGRIAVVGADPLWPVRGPDGPVLDP